MNTNSRGIASYLGITFGLAWTAWLAPLPFGVSLGDPLYNIFILTGACSPAIACLVVRKWITGEGFSDAGLRPSLRTWKYYAAAWLYPVLVVAGIMLAALVFDIARPDFSFLDGAAATSANYPHGNAFMPVRPSMMIFGPLFQSILAIPILFGEEFGWRSYLQIRIFQGRPILSAVATGIIWGIWHFPINLQGYNFPDNRMAGLVVFPVTTILLSIIIGWVRLRSGSVWAASLAHASFNAIGGSWLITFYFGGSTWLFLSPAGILSWIPLGVIAVIILATGQLKEPVQQK
jgi:uncharacterized protein